MTAMLFTCFFAMANIGLLIIVVTVKSKMFDDTVCFYDTTNISQ